MVTSSTLQSLNKFKSVYLTSLLGYITNAVLDVPLMLLMHSLGFEPFIGAILASILGYSFSVVTAMYVMRKDHKLRYKSSFKMLGKLILPTLIMTVVVLILKAIIPLDITSKFSCILYVAIISILGAITYLFVTYKQGTLMTVFGKEYLNKIMKKITFGKVQIK